MGAFIVYKLHPTNRVFKDREQTWLVLKIWVTVAK